MIAVASVRQALRGLKGRSARDVLLVAETALSLALARLVTVVLPFQQVVRLTGLRAGVVSSKLDVKHAELADRMSWAMSAMAGRTPWQSRCLAQALAAQTMLRWRGIGCTLYLGVAPGAISGTSFAAHAWLRCGNVTVTGANEQANFAELVAFGRETG